MCQCFWDQSSFLPSKLLFLLTVAIYEAYAKNIAKAAAKVSLLIVKGRSVFAYSLALVIIIIAEA